MNKIPSPPSTQRRFGSVWSELAYLCGKIHYWLYTRKRKSHAVRYLERLELVLSNLPDNDLAITRQEALALRSELKGEIGKSLLHRQQEIELMERLHEEAQRHDISTRAYMLRDRGPAVLRERRALMQSLQKTKGQQSGELIHSAR